MNEYQPDEWIVLNTGERVQVFNKDAYGMYQFRSTTLKLTANEIMMNTSAYWRDATPRVIAQERKLRLL